MNGQDENQDVFTKPPIKRGTTESDALQKLGMDRRKMTGVLGRRNKVRFLTISSSFMKPFSIVNSALGLTITILLLVKADFWSLTFWISFAVGLAVGVFFELWSTNSEHAFVLKEELDEIADPDKAIYKKILISIKTYAVAMVLVSAWNLPDYIFVQQQNQDDDYITTRLAKIERLKEDKESAGTGSNSSSVYLKLIADLKEEKAAIEAEKTPAIIANSTSKHVKKRESAIGQINAINQRIENKSAEILEANKEMIKASSKSPSEIYEEKISKVEDEIQKRREHIRATSLKDEGNTLGITIMLGVLFVFIELGGTIASILAGRAILSSVSPEEAYKDSVTNGLFNNKIALSERNTNLRATKIAVDIDQNEIMTEIIGEESKVMAQNHKLIEDSRLAEIDRENAKLLTDIKFRELESQQLLEITKGVKAKLDGVETIRKQIGQLVS
jgi:hypothetical protein